jgi:hypothetical protein
METCVTVTWMKFCYQLLRLTGDARYADELETSLYNALLSAQMPNGNWWAYYNGLMGERMPSDVQFADCVMSCCVANGPRALLLTPRWAVMRSADGIAVNLYGRGSARVRLPSGREAELIQETDYPENGRVALRLKLAQPEEFALQVRVPAWSKETRVDGKSVQPGYARIQRTWADGDQVQIEFDFRPRLERSPAGTRDAALVRGPIMLAFDSRLTPQKEFGFEPPLYRLRYPETLKVTPAADPRFWMTFDVEFVDEAGGKHILKLCDYASAGNAWSAADRFRVWMPQPFDLRDIFINGADRRLDTWGGARRAKVPEIYRDPK